jgi:GT2 family glycosyltransferase
MSEPVTLLIPNFNGARWLRESIPALLRQSFPHFRLVVVDNKSTDDSAELVRSFADPRLRLVEHDEHVPVCGNFQRAQKLVDTPFYATCACDEVYEPKWLEVMMGLLEREPDAFFACCKADSADEHGQIYLAPQERFKSTFWPREEPAVFSRERDVIRFLQGNYLIITTGVFRTSATNVVGPLNEQAVFTGDWEYWVRGLLAGFTIIGTHQRLVHYRRHDQMTTRKMNADLRRFGDELETIRWITQQVFDHRLRRSPEPDYRLVRNTLLCEYAAGLSRGDAVTNELLQYGEANIPGFRGSFFHRVAKMAGRLGRVGGFSLRAGQWSYLRLLGFRVGI